MCSKTLKNHEIYIHIASTGSSFTPINFLPPFCVVDVEWWVEDQLVIEESFNLKAKSSGTLQPQFWKMGQTVRDFPENSFSQICYCFITVLEQKHTLSTCQFYLVIFFQKSSTYIFEFSRQSSFFV